MANTGLITVLQPDITPGTDISETFYLALANIDLLADQTSTSFTGYDLVDGFAIDFDGSGLTFDSKTGNIAGGTVTNYTIRDSDGRLFTGSFAPGTKALDVAKASQAFFDSGFTNSSKLDAIFGAYAITFRGNDGDEAFQSGNQADTLSGGGGADELIGGGGNDTIEGGAGADELDGDTGIDTVSYANSTAGVTVNLSIVDPTAQTSPGDASGDKLKNFENVLGSAFDDELIGDGNANVITGGKGGDALNGAGGIDTILGGDGNDFVNSGAGADVLDGGAGVDALEYNTVKTSITVLLGAKDVQTTVTGTAGSDAVGDKIKNFERVFGGDGNDVLTGNADANRINGNAGDDVIQGGAGADDMDGGGNTAVGDTLSYAGSKDGVTIDLGTGAGSGGDAEGDSNVQGFEIVIGSGKNDRLISGNGIDDLLRFDGGAGDDIIVSLADVTTTNRAIGGMGFDTLSFEGAATGVAITLSLQGTADAKGNITGGGGGNGSVGGNTQAAQMENLTGSANKDILFGDKNANVIEGGDGGDTLDGGGGIDTLSYASDTTGVGVALKDGSTAADVTGGHAAGDTATNFTHLLGGSNNDVLTGNSAANTVKGGGGDDVLRGLDGVDTLEGGAGNDNLLGGKGVDTFNGGDGFDAAVFDQDSGLNAGITVTLGKDGALSIVTGKSGEPASGDKLINIEAVAGHVGNDVLTGNNLANRFWGNTGDDLIQGGAGADELDGGEGDETLGDTLSYAASAQGVTVSLNPSASGGDAEGDTIGNFENLVGSAKNDDLRGDGDKNKIDGGSGDDIIEGRAGADILLGGMGNDTLSYAGENSSVTVALVLNKAADVSAGGNAGTDAEGDNATGFEHLIGGSVADVLTGDTGNNRIDGGAGADTLDGGAGTGDQVMFFLATGGVTLVLGAGGAETTASGAETDKVKNFENITGSNFKDDLTGNELANTLVGLDDEDKLTGAAGNDTLLAGNGNDILIGGIGNDYLQGDPGDDTIDGGAGADVMDGSEGTDDQLDYSALAAGVTATLAFGETGKQTMVTATAGSDAAGDKIMNFEHYLGGDAKDVVTGNSLANILEGGGGNNSLKGGAGNDTLEGGGGDDVIEGGAGADVLNGGGNTDTLSYASSKNGVTINISFNTAQGGDAEGDTISGFENLIGSATDDILGVQLDDGVPATIIQGGAGNDRIIAGSWNDDTFDGGAGIDTISFESGGFTNTVTLGLAVAQNTGTGNDLILNFENIIGSDTNDKLVGDGKNNVIEGGLGNDTLDGGLGIDTLSYAGATAGVTVDLINTTQQNTVGAGKDTVSGFENILGSAKNDDFKGDDAVNKIEGGDGDDKIAGGKGADILFGGIGDDIISGGSEGDVIDGGAGLLDTVSYESETKGVTVGLGKDGTAVATVGGGAAGDKITNVEAVVGTSQNDVLTGNNLANGLMGGDGDDLIQGGAGGDELDGEEGGETNGDTLSYSLSTQGVSVSLNTAASGGDAQGDLIFNFENLIGSAKNDILSGDGDKNKIDGGAGDDRIEGRDGADTLIGGLGNDTVSYSESGAGVTVDLSLATAQTGGTGHSLGDVLSGFEHIIGSANADKLTGDAKNNIIEGGAGADTLDGGGGINTLSYAGDKTGVSVNIGSKAASGGDAAGDTIDFTTFANLIGGSGNDTLRGNTGNNVISGNAGNDTLFSGAGGNDTFDGGDGFDFVGVGGSGVMLSATVNLAAGTATIGTSKHTLISIEATQGSDVADTFSALGFGATSKNAGSAGINNHLGAFNQFEGLGGDDTILGNGTTRITYSSNKTAGVTADLGVGSVTSTESGTDTIVGGVNSVRGTKFGDDLFGSDIIDVEVFEGLGGSDDIDGRGGFDRAIYALETSGVTITLIANNLGTVTDGLVPTFTDTITNVEFFRGSEQADKFDAALYTNDFDDLNEFEGLGGDDDITGNGETRITFQSSSAPVTVDLGANTATGADIGKDTLADSTIRSVRGSDFDDIIRGNSLDNVLNGGLGNDSLEGAGGADRFIYTLDDKNGGGIDTIKDYNAGQDRIDLGGISSMLVYADVRALMHDVGADVVIDFGGGNKIVILNEKIANLDANQGDFLFS